MIQNLTIQNFQSHRDSHLEFAPGVNVIVGATDSGKTAIIRALRWLIWNKPGGDAFRSDWGGDTAVELWVNGFGFIRNKGKENLYVGYLEEHPDQKPKTYKAFGTGVPEDIALDLNFHEVNLQSQLDAHFLLSSSPGEVAAYFNRIANLDKIDSALKKLNSGVRQMDTMYQNCVARIEFLEEDLQKFDYLDKAEAELEVLEEMHQQWESTIKRKNKLEFLIAQIEEVDKKQEEHAGIISFKEEVDRILQAIEARNTCFDKLCALQEVSAEVTKIDSDIDYLTKTARLAPEVDNVLALIESREMVLKSTQKLKKQLQMFQRLEDDIDKAEIGLEAMREDFHAEMPDECPLCGSQIHFER